MKIKFDKRNYRQHNEKNKELIKKSLVECGAGRSIFIDNEGEIIGGNGVYEQAKALKMPVKIIESDGTELVVVKRTDLSTNDEKRKRLAILDNSTTDTSDFDLTLLSQDFLTDDLIDLGIDLSIPDVEILPEEMIDNEKLPELNTSKKLALQSMPISKYLCLIFDENHKKEDFIENIAKKLNPKANVTEKTQYCDVFFNKKELLND